jgi:hypothetical protein
MRFAFAMLGDSPDKRMWVGSREILPLAVLVPLMRTVEAAETRWLFWALAIGGRPPSRPLISSFTRSTVHGGAEYALPSERPYARDRSRPGGNRAGSRRRQLLLALGAPWSSSGRVG